MLKLKKKSLVINDQNTRHFMSKMTCIEINPNFGEAGSQLDIRCWGEYLESVSQVESIPICKNEESGRGAYRGEYWILDEY